MGLASTTGPPFWPAIIINSTKSYNTSSFFSSLRSPTHNRFFASSRHAKSNFWNCDAKKTTTFKVNSSILEKDNNEINDETCELVNGIELSIGEGDDSIDAYLFKAVKNNNETGLLLLSDIFGFEDSATRDFAYRLACSGYNVLVPDLFRGDPWVKNQEMTTFEQWIEKQEPKRVAKDIATSRKWMVDQFMEAGISNKLGLIGFCYGGGKVIEELARDEGVHFGIGVSFYGTRLNQALAFNVKVPVLFISGDNDPLCQVSVLKNIEKEIEGSRVVIFNGRGHGFVHRPQSPEEDEDAEKAFMITRNWLNEGLVQKNYQIV